MERAPCEVFTSGTLVDPELLQGAAGTFGDRWVRFEGYVGARVAPVLLGFHGDLW